MRGLIGVAAFIFLAMLAAVLAARLWAPEFLPAGHDQARLAYLVGWVAMLSAAIFLFGRIPLGQAVRGLLVWAGIILFLVAAYALRDDFGELYAQVRGELLPFVPAVVSMGDPADPDAPPAAASVRRAPDGHFWAEAEVNGARVRFLVDTGASTVALAQRDAERAGIDTEALRYNTQIMTAGGATFGAQIRLDEVSVGGVRLENVQAIVIQGETLPISLLGMSFLGRLSGYEATPNTLILRQ